MYLLEFGPSTARQITDGIGVYRTGVNKALDGLVGCRRVRRVNGGEPATRVWAVNAVAGK
jgi:hypothetical protein